MGAAGCYEPYIFYRLTSFFSICVQHSLSELIFSILSRTILGICINTKVPGIPEQYFFNGKAGCPLPDVQQYILR